MDESSRKYLEGIDLSKLPPNAGPIIIAVNQAAAGVLVTAKCADCKQPIAVEPKGQPVSAWVHSCACGKCNGAFRGL